MKVRSKNGFTLIELMMVIAVMGVILMVAYPTFKASRRDSTMYFEARKVMADYSYMQQLAMDEQTVYKMVPDIGGENYELLYGAPKEGVVVKSEDLGNGMVFDDVDPNAEIEIGSNGLPINGAQEITLKDRDDFKIHIFIKSGGKVELSWNDIKP